ncbi:hypothetical protein [Flavobacterium sp.]|uniref:hypothetical protein n=1 Tax=Flavobacterium sp. TaxID=239 RepID=UPI00374CA8AC
MKVIELIQKGEIYAFEEEKNCFLFSRFDNNLYNISNETYEYLSQKLDDFVLNKNNEEIIFKPLNTTNKKINNNLTINFSVYQKDTLSLVIKNILDNYNFYNIVYLVIEINNETINLIEEIIKWFNGYERIVIVCRVNMEENYFLNVLKSNLNRLSKITTIKFIIDSYHVLYNLDNNNSENKSIKISPLLSSRILNDIEKKIVVDLMFNTPGIKQYNKSLQSNLKIRPLVIQSINDKELLRTCNDTNNCNSCWAKNACFSNNLYNTFSSHPYSCSLNKQNCDIIKETLEKVFNINISNKKNQLEEKLSNKSIIFQKFSIIHLNT